MNLPDTDKKIIRDLAKEVAEIADMPVQEERKKLWTAHNDLELKKPLIYISPEGSWGELIPHEVMQCSTDQGRKIEFQLRRRIYGFRHFVDDMVIEKTWEVGKKVKRTGWGMETKRIASTEKRGAWHFDPVLKETSDLKKLTQPTIEPDDDATEQALAENLELFGDILDVQLTGFKQVGYHLMSQFTGWRGLQETMMDMYCEPQFLHDAMRTLTDYNKNLLQQMIQFDLLDLNNDNSYQGSGGNGWSNQLPQPDFNGTVRPCDIWGKAEAQEMAQVGPKQHREFILDYEIELLAPFGLNSYGCCEDLTDKLDDVFDIPNIRRISISPWADVVKCAEKLKGNYVYSWKPNPAHLVGAFNEAFIRDYIRNTVETCAAHDCVLEIVLKDTHTCEHKPERFDRWVQIAREEVERI